MKRMLLATAFATSIFGAAASAQETPRASPVPEPGLQTNTRDPQGVVTTTPRTNASRGLYISGSSGKGEGSDLGQ
jgi:hypothetical protein